MQWAKINKGFTIVELLIVVVVIAILAAITIVSYNGVQSRAKIASVQSELSALNKKIELYKAEKGLYPINSDNLAWKNIFVETVGDIYDTSKKSFVLCRSVSGASFGVAAWAPISPPTGGAYYYVSSTTSSVMSAIWNGNGSFGTTAAAVCDQLLGPSFQSSWAHNL